MHLSRKIWIPAQIFWYLLSKKFSADNLSWYSPSWQWWHVVVSHYEDKRLWRHSLFQAGPQGFRPQHGKTPLHRAKENAHKRLYAQTEAKSVQVSVELTQQTSHSSKLSSNLNMWLRLYNVMYMLIIPKNGDSSKSRWESSRGNLYNGTPSSRPESVKRDDDRDAASRERLEQ